MATGSLLRRRLIPLIICVFLTVQIAVPAVALLGPRPARFAWQMYSGSRTMASFSVVHADGSVEPVDLNDYFANPRLEMDLIELVPPRVCSLVEDAEAVRVEHVLGDPEDVRCSTV